ncbi:bifunctional metallophosphatase/5'-nucleotidase [Halorubrum tibetense]|uniref:Bifunctional metallophosphatase/5'-nucleotidase n=1 Tax=Halorubrum tibetense TaxID=175631 RepID=A0ABD5SB31_9EURY
MSNDRRSTGTVDERRRRLLAGAAGGLTVGALGLGGTGSAAAADEDTLTIIHDTHFHGRFEDADVETLDIARYQTLVDELRAEYPNAIYLGNGDDLAPSVLGLEFEGEHMIEALNETDIDAIGAGNHEFDFGVEVAEERFEESTFPWVIANLLTPDGDPVPGAERWTTVETADHTVDVFGMGTSGFHDITDYPDDWQVLGYEEAAEDAVEALEAETDFIVCASHAPSGAHSTIASVDGVDAVVGSHSGIVFDEPDESGNGVIAEFGDEFDHIGRLTFEVDDAALTDWERLDLYDSAALDEEAYPEETDHHTPVDVQDVGRTEELAEIADGYLDELEERLGEPVVESEVELDATFANYENETAWGNLMTDIMRSVDRIVDVDREIEVAVQNAGGIRSNATYGPGDITGSDVMDILPFPNEIEVWEVEGATIRNYLEWATRAMPDDFGAQPAIQVSGLSYEWNGHDDDWEQGDDGFPDGGVYEIFVGGEPLDEDETYLLATNDFEAGRSPIAEEGELVVESGQFQGPFTMDYLEAETETVSPAVGHRIVRVDEDVGDAALAADNSVTATFPVPEGAEVVVDDGFRAVSRTQEVAEATAVEVDGDEVVVTFDADDLLGLAAVDDPRVRVYGHFDPDDAYYGYEDGDGYVDLPVNPSYEFHKLKASVSDSDLEAVAGALEDDEDTADDDGEEAAADDDEEEGVEDDVPGFGPAAGAAGIAGGAYLYSKYGANGDEASTDD